ncbi:MAG: radical SAM protein [Rhodospirillaceae bacterium]|nr:radical SAM protein [Rhodospirillaceae bacterium]MBT5373837.1 radical SAM protein [Rhodospirillaceae bacterium]MBT5658948.1 radical SAM protein [Rhodospirillaceae bacterium]
MTKLYSSLKPFRFPGHLEAIRERRLLAPVNIRIKPMNHCNHDCWYCAYRVSNLQLGEDMDVKDQIPRDKMFEIVDDIVDMGVKAVTFSGGGEPLLYKPLPEVIEALAKGGVKIGSLTNGSNLKGKVADAFAKHATWVRVSMEGWDGPSYAKARRIGEDAFDKLIINMRDFIARQSKCVLGVSLIIGEDNHTHVSDICALLKDVGVNHVKLVGAITSNDGAEFNDYHRKLKPRIDEEIELAKALATEGFAILDHYHEMEERFDRPYTICPNIQFNPVIGGDCVVYTCHDKAFTKDGTLGSIKDRSFKDFWFSEENRERVYAINPQIHCPHHCADHAKILGMMDYLAIDPEHGQFV